MGNQLIITLKGKTARTQMVRLRDPRIQKATPEPYGSGSRLVVVFRKTVPAYKVFLLKNPRGWWWISPAPGGHGHDGPETRVQSVGWARA